MELELATFEQIAEEIGRRYDVYVMAAWRTKDEEHGTVSMRFGGAEVPLVGLANILRAEVEVSVKGDREEDEDP